MWQLEYSDSAIFDGLFWAFFVVFWGGRFHGAKMPPLQNGADKLGPYTIHKWEFNSFFTQSLGYPFIFGHL